MDHDGTQSADSHAELPLALANTVYTRHGKIRDDLAEPAQLAAWLARIASALETPLPGPGPTAVTEADLRDARELRDAVRAVLAALDDGAAPDAESRYRLNWRAAAAPAWPQLQWDDGPVRVRVSDAPPVSAALSEIAGAAVDLFASRTGASLAACASPECIRYFAKTDPRRKWCSPQCGNRARVRTHYHRTRR